MSDLMEALRALSRGAGVLGDAGGLLRLVDPFTKFFGQKKPGVIEEETPKSPPSNQASDITANKAMKDEARELHALLEAMSSDNTGINYVPKASEFWIPAAIAARLKPGAVKKLFDSFATEVVSVRHSEVKGYTQHEPDPNGKPRKETPIKEEFTSEMNHLGPQIIRGLMWLAVKSQASADIPAPPAGTDPKLKGVIYVVGFLETSRLLENVDDKLTAAGEKGKALAAFAAKNTDTLAHLVMAFRKLGYNWGNLQMILRSPTVWAARDAIDDAKEGQPTLDAHEAFQAALIEAVTAHHRRPGWLARQMAAAEKRRAENRRLVIMCGCALIALIIITRWLFAA